MARTFGRILNSIWDDEDFLALSAGEQRLYTFLLSQPNTSHAGLLSMTLRRWAGKARDLTVEDVSRDLAGLHNARFLVVDFETEEVLVRSLVRRDEVYKMPRVLGSAVADAMGVSSRKIRRALLAEFDRIPLAELSEEPTKGRDGRLYPPVRTQVIGHIEALRRAYGPMDANTQFEPLPEGVQEPVCEGDPGGSGVRTGARVSPTPSPSPSPSPIENPSASATPSAGNGDRKRARKPRAAIEEPEAFARFWKAYPRKKDKGLAEKAWNKVVREGVDPNVLVDGALFYRLDTANRDAEHIKYPASWLNARAWQDEPDPERKAPSPIGAPSVAAAVQPPSWAEQQRRMAELDARENGVGYHDAGFDFGDAFGMPA